MKATSTHRALRAVGVAVGLLIALAVGPAANGAGASATTTVPLDPTTLAKYVDALPIPPVAQPTAPAQYELTMMAGTAKLHRDLPPAAVWGYGGGYLGPTFDVRSGMPFRVRWTNGLPTTHMFAASLDHTLDGMLGDDGNPLPESRAVTHLHGGHVSEASDGNADQWFLPGESKDDTYPNDQPATALWYHDHALGTTRLNPYAGLAGFYIVRDAREDALDLPRGAFELPIVIQDKSFGLELDGAGDVVGSSLLYATVGALPSVHPTWVPEFFGDAVVVNGKAWPYVDVEPRMYRLRLLNGSNARFYGLTFAPDREHGNRKPTIWQIGADGGFLPAAVPLDRVLLAPGERADVLVDFADYAGSALVLRNNAKAPYPAGDSPNPRTVGQVMQFRVRETVSSPDTTVVPAAPLAVPRITPTAGTEPRDVKLSETLDPLTGVPVKLQLEGKGWLDRPATLTPRLHTTEVWRLINTTADTHPIHLHLVEFQVVSRQRFDVGRYETNGNRVEPTLIGLPRWPAPNEMGWKDTVQVNPGEVVSIAATFDNPGVFPIHCHILEHEENDMMRPFAVVPGT